MKNLMATAAVVVLGVCFAPASHAQTPLFNSGNLATALPNGSASTGGTWTQL